jgi:hypothetical protein
MPFRMFCSPGGISFPAENVHALLDTLDKGVVVASRDGRILMVNARARQCLHAHGSRRLEQGNIASLVGCIWVWELDWNPKARGRRQVAKKLTSSQQPGSVGTAGR